MLVGVNHTRIVGNKKYLEPKVQGIVLECELPSTGRQARVTGMCCNAVGVYFKYSRGGAAAAPADYSTWCVYVTIGRRVRVTCGWQERCAKQIEIGETERLIRRKDRLVVAGCRGARGCV